MKKHLKILTAFAFLALPNLCASAEDMELSRMEEARSQSISGKIIQTRSASSSIYSLSIPEEE